MWLDLAGEKYEKARICVQGQNHEGSKCRTNADAHHLRLFLAVHANPNNVLTSFDVSNFS